VEKWRRETKGMDTGLQAYDVNGRRRRTSTSTSTSTSGFSVSNRTAGDLLTTAGDLILQ